MGTFQECMVEYKSQLAKGIIQQAYRGLMDYFSDLRTHFQKRFSETEVSGGVYFGYMDMTYFAVIPAFLKQRKLKIAIVFLHEAFRFEVWLSGYNRQVQALGRTLGAAERAAVGPPGAGARHVEHPAQRGCCGISKAGQ